MAIKVTHGTDGITPTCDICVGRPVADQNVAPTPRRAQTWMIVRVADARSCMMSGRQRPDVFWSPRIERHLA